MTTDELVNKLTELRAEVAGPVTPIASKLLNQILGQCIESFRLEQQYQNLRRDGMIRKVEWLETKKLTEADFDNLFKAEELHKEITERLNGK